MGLREPEGAAEEGAEARAPEASMAGEARAGEDLKSRFGTPRGRGAPHPLAPAREHLGGEKRKGQRWVVAARHPTGSLRQRGGGGVTAGTPSPLHPTTGTQGPQPATTGGAAERVVVMGCAVGPWHGPAPRGHGECLRATLRGASSPSGRWGAPQGLGTALRATGSTARPWRASLAARRVPPGRGLGKRPGAVAGATAATSAPQQLLLGHGEDLGQGQHLRATTGPW